MSRELIKRFLSSIVLIPIVLFIIIKGSILFNFFITICFLITAYEWHKMSINKSYYLYGFIFLIFSFYTIFELISFAGSYHYFLTIMIICISTDIGGFIFGKIFKGPKLIKISPKKTYSGALGGFILSLVAALIYSKYTGQGAATYINLSIWTGIALNKIYFLFILFISLVSQIGDLIVSYFKRLAKVKNTGNLLPGHGGLLDRIDGIIFAIPISYLLLNYLK